jgi:surface antigen
MRLLSLRNTSALMAAAILLAGCNTTSGGGRSLVSARSSSSTSYISALQGGIVGRTGADLSGSDRSRALEAEYRALEGAAGGQAVEWKGSDASGEVIANAPYQVGTQNCRQYRHTVTVKGKDMVAKGAACRNDDGTWTPLT